ncbi:MAG: thioredoxin domain-containing protein [Deltaproteobacteria bacterium]|nr:thioredoxin domain-containing protein [Deltaproteobacteria bacterium]
MRGRAASAALLLLALLGLVDAGFLAWDHQVFVLDPAGAAGLCQRGHGCEISRISYWSEVPLGSARPGLPIALLGAGFYVAVMVLALRRLLRPEDERPLRLVALTSLGAVVYSVVLAGVSFGAQGKLCPYCAVLYGVNLLLLVVALLALRERFGSLLAGSLRAALSGVGATALLAFLIAVGAGYAAYSAPLLASVESRHQKMLEAATTLSESPTVALADDGRPSAGPADAPVHIIEVADLECPYCKRLFHTLHAIAEAQPQRVRLTFLHHPLDSACNPLIAQPFHADACRLAIAAECAHPGGRFFEMAGWIFDRGPSVTRDELIAHAAELGLDGQTYTRCLDDPAVVETIQADIARGAEAGVKGTPNFFVNGHHVVGTRDRDVIERMIDSVAPDGAAGKPATAAEGGR